MTPKFNVAAANALFSCSSTDTLNNLSKLSSALTSWPNVCNENASAAYTFPAIWTNE